MSGANHKGTKHTKSHTKSSVPVHVSMQVDLKTTWDACGEAFHRYTSDQQSFAELIERPEVFSLIGDVKGLRLLDLGCGSGIYSSLFARQGAQVVGVDISSTMIEIAHRGAVDDGLSIEFGIGDISKPLDLPDSEFDVVFSSTVFHYIFDLELLFGEIARVMKPDARLVASVLHPFNTSRFPLAPLEDGVEAPSWSSRREWLAKYGDVRERMVETPWLDCGDVPTAGRSLRCRHHTVAAYLSALKSAGLSLTDLREPSPPEKLRSDNLKKFEEAFGVPIFLILCACKSVESIGA